MDFHAPYEGNFIASLKNLEEKAKEFNYEVFYLFPNEVLKTIWFEDFKKYRSKRVFLVNKGIFIETYKTIDNIVKVNNINIIHTHFRNWKLELATTLRANTLKDITVITHLHSSYTKVSKIKEFLRKSTRLNNKYIACSETVLKDFLTNSGINNNRAYMISNGINYDRFNKIESRKNYIKSDEKLSIVCFGYDWEVKGIDIIYKAVAEINDENKQLINLNIVVAKNKDKLIEKILNKNKIMPSWLNIINPVQNVSEIFDGNQLFISASRREGFPYAVLEAAYHGSHVLLSDIKPHKEIEFLKEDNFFESENVESLKKKLKYLIENQKLERKSLLEIKNVEKNYGRKYGIEEWSKKIIGVYNDQRKL